LLGSGEFGQAVVIADLEAGIGTLTRLAEEQVDATVVVVEPTPRSLDVARRAIEVAAERRQGRLVVVANKVGGADDIARVREALGDVELVEVPIDPAVVAADREGRSPVDDDSSTAVAALVELTATLVPAELR
jgi:CO dehydrogenase maturation factor